MRSVLLAGAESVWLREKAMRRPFVRRSVSRFMPGETVDEALAACRRQQEQHGTGTILTHLGENLSSLAEAEAVTSDYLELIDRIASEKLDVQVSVKLTQLGLDLGLDACDRNLAAAGRSRRVPLEHRLDRHGEHEVRRSDDRRCSAALASGRRAWVCACSPTCAGRWPTSRRCCRSARPSGSSRARIASRRTWCSRARRRWTRTTSGSPCGCCSRTCRTGRSSASGPTTRGWSSGSAPRSRRGAPTASSYEFEMLYGIQRPLQARLVAERAPLRVLDQLRRVLVPVVHATAGRAAGQRAVRHEESVRGVVGRPERRRGPGRRATVRRSPGAGRASARRADEPGHD